MPIADILNHWQLPRVFACPRPCLDCAIRYGCDVRDFAGLSFMPIFDLRTNRTALRHALENGYLIDANVLVDSMIHMQTRPFTFDLRVRLIDFLRVTPLNPARRTQVDRAKGDRLALDARTQEHLNENCELQLYLLRFLEVKPLQDKGAPKRSVGKLLLDGKIDMFASYFFRTLKERTEHGKPVVVPELADITVPTPPPDLPASEPCLRMTQSYLDELGFRYPCLRTLLEIPPDGNGSGSDPDPILLKLLTHASVARRMVLEGTDEPSVAHYGKRHFWQLLRIG